MSHSLYVSVPQTHYGLLPCGVSRSGLLPMARTAGSGLLQSSPMAL